MHGRGDDTFELRDSGERRDEDGNIVSVSFSVNLLICSFELYPCAHSNTIHFCLSVLFLLMYS